MATRVLIVEDEPEFMRRFSGAVLSDPSLSLVAAVNHGTAGIAMLDLERPDVLLIDLGLPDLPGVEVIRHAARAHPSCDVLVVTMFADDAHVVASIEAGATGYLLKDASVDRIVGSIHELRAGGAPISPGIARRVLARFRQAMEKEASLSLHGDAEPPARWLSASTGQPGVGAALTGAPAASTATPDPVEPTLLTPRETELLRLVAKGFTFDVIGEVLAISPHTVVAHVKKIYRKLAVHSRSEAVYEAGQIGLL